MIGLSHPSIAVMSNIVEGLGWWDFAPPQFSSAQVLDYEYSWRRVCAVLHYTFPQTFYTSSKARTTLRLLRLRSASHPAQAASINMQHHTKLCLSSLELGSHPFSTLKAHSWHEDSSKIKILKMSLSLPHESTILMKLKKLTSNSHQPKKIWVHIRNTLMKLEINLYLKTN